jgi:nucleoid-associated protein YgaU
MLPSFRFALAATLLLGSYNLVSAQDAATPPATTSGPSTDDVVKLTEENAALKKEVSDAKQTIAQLQAQLYQSGQQPAATTAAPSSDAATNAAPAGPMKALPLDAPNPTVAAATPGAPAADAGPSKSYTVVKGDSIWKIAHKMYPGDTKNGVDKIQEANKDAIGGKPLKIGQVLVIPQ